MQQLEIDVNEEQEPTTSGTIKDLLNSTKATTVIVDKVQLRLLHMEVLSLEASAGLWHDYVNSLAQEEKTGE